jgi:hypothetical protein
LANQPGLTAVPTLRIFDPYTFLGEDQPAAPAKAAKPAKADGGVAGSLATLATLAAATPETKNPAWWSESEEERAAIVEYSGGKIPREWAEGFARLNPDQPPAGVPPRRWLQFVDDTGGFLDSPFCAVAAALGWVRSTCLAAIATGPSPGSIRQGSCGY